MASWVGAPRVVGPRLVKMERRWACTVRGLMIRRLALSEVVAPRLIEHFAYDPVPLARALQYDLRLPQPNANIACMIRKARAGSP